MAVAVKKELILENLDCPVCAAKIEDQIRRLDDVRTVSVNIATKVLTIEATSDGDLSDILDKASKIVSTNEPDVIIKEKQVISKPGKKVLILDGLDCSNCAAKIEKAVKNIDGVVDASVDFTTRRLSFEVLNARELSRVVMEASRTVQSIEDGIKIIDLETAESESEDHEGIDTKDIVRLVAGVIIYFTAIAFRFDDWLEFVLFLTSFILVGGEVLLKAAKNIIRGQVFDENFLMSIATIGAFAIKEYPEAVAVMLFYEVGELFEKLAIGHSRRSISALMDIRPDYANLKMGDVISRVSPEQVKIGDVIIIKPGEKIPLDGQVIDGFSMIDTSAITGESVPREVQAGDPILSGTINKNGLLTVSVTKEFGESTVSKILDLVQNASSKKAPTEKFITRFAHYYTPAVVVAAALLAVVPPLLIPGAEFSDWLYRALVFLVVSCPCALVISIPLGFFGGIGGASKNGILIKGSNYLEALTKVDTVVFDKTGTLTKGVFKVTKVENKLGTDQNLLQLADYSEAYSSHPIARSILDAYGLEIDKDKILEYDEIPGFGTTARLKDMTIYAGNAKFFASKAIEFDEADDLGTIVYLAINNQFAGHIVISDEIKDDAELTIRRLKSLGVKKQVMLTGDSIKVGEKIGKQLGLDKVYGDLLPNQKLEILELLEKEKQTSGKVVFVGDGINDAPVLMRADVGIAMGGLGSDAAIEASDIVIMTDEPSKVATAIQIARRTRQIIWQNIGLAFAVKGLVLLLATGGIATMWEAVFADIGVALIAIFNAMRVLHGKNH